MFSTHPFDFYRVVKYPEQTLCITQKSSKERKIYFHPTEICSEKTMTLVVAYDAYEAYSHL